MSVRPIVSRPWLVLVCWLGMSLSAAGELQAPRPEAANASDLWMGRTSERRVVKHFDFDERELGNVEDVPMHWLRYRAGGFPHFLAGQFDDEVGHDGPPSFVLTLEGKSLAYHYYATDIPVKPSSDYLIVAWIRPQGLDYARAYVSGYFLDRDRNKIAQSERFSVMVPGPDSSQGWQQVTVSLPGQYERARFMGLTVWLCQPEIWQSRPGPDWQIYRQTIHGRAWFDDITVYRLPRIRLNTTEIGNVFPPQTTPTLLAEVGDPDGYGLEARVLVRDAEQRTVLSQSVPVRTSRMPKPFALEAPELPPGLYYATLTVSAKQQELVRRDLAFARLAPLPSGRSGTPAPFGIDLGYLPAGASDSVISLTSLLGVKLVRLPIWQANAATQPLWQPNREFELLLRRLVGRQIGVVAALAHPAQGLAEQNDLLQRSLLDIFSGPPDKWRPYLAVALARYTDVVSHWQIGGETDYQVIEDSRLPGTLELINNEIVKLVTSPAVVSPWSAVHQMPVEHFQTQYVCLQVPVNVTPESIPAQLAHLTREDQHVVWVSLAGLQRQEYRRIPRLIDLAKRIVYSRVAGAQTTFLARPWEYRDGATAAAQPTEEFLVYRTLVSLLGQATPAGKVYLGPRTECFVFDHGVTSTLVAWNDYATDHDPAVAQLWLGEQARQIDLWGRASPLRRIGTRQEVRVGPTPILIDGVDSWIARLRGSLTITPRHLESSFKVHRVWLRFANPRHEAISGRLELAGPRGWQLRPWQVRFALQPGQAFEQELTIRFPYNEPAGQKLISARFSLNLDRNYQLQISLPVQLGLKGIEVQTIPQLLDGQLVVRQSVTNRTSETVKFRTALILPDRPPQRRAITALLPGQSITKFYVFKDAQDLIGQELRASLEEVQGRRVLNEVIRIR